MTTQSLYRSAVLFALALLLGGCQTVSFDEPGPRSDAPPARGSLAFNGPRLQRAVANADIDQSVLPWYADRADRREAVVAGAATARFEQSFTHTIDRQRQSHGRVFDNYQSTTYSRSYVETVR